MTTDNGGELTPAPREYMEFVEQGVTLMQERDDNSWALGDLAVEFIQTFDDPEGPTLGDLAGAWNVSKQRVSEWRNVAEFYPTDVRTIDLPWEIFNAARRASSGSLDNALELLDYADRQHMTVAAFRRYLKGIRFEGPVRYSELPERIRALLPSEAAFWCELKRWDGDK